MIKISKKPKPYNHTTSFFKDFFTKNMKLEFEYPIEYLKMEFGITKYFWIQHSRI